MYFLYSLLLGLASFALLPYFAFQACRHQKYLSNFRERLGRLPAGLAGDGRPAVWLHAVSIGEALSARPLLGALRAHFPGHRLIVSTTTVAGQAVARARLSEADGFCYFPFDWGFAVRRALRAVRPQVVILMESELWPNFLRECRRRGIPVVVANGRISDRSFARLEKFGRLARRLFGEVTRFEMQSEADAARAVALGAAPARVGVSGNLKYDLGGAPDAAQLDEVARRLDGLFALSSAPLIVGGSTSEGEEEALLAALEELRREPGLARTRLLLAPRRPERFEAVAHLLDSARLTFARRSAGAPREEVVAADGLRSPGPAGPDPRGADVILLDSVGELAAVYRFAAVVFVGGSLIARGGHNILEPALDARPIVVGPHMENFRGITDEFLRRGALVQLRGAGARELAAELRETLSALLLDEGRARSLGASARAAVDANRGATARTVDAVIAVSGQLSACSFVRGGDAAAPGEGRRAES